MGFSPQDAQEIVHYNRIVFARFVRRARSAGARAAFRSRGLGHDSWFRTLVHILNVQEVWLVFLVQGRDTDEELGRLFADPHRTPADWPQFDGYSRRVWSEVERSVRSLTDRDLKREVHAFWMPGRYTVRDAVLQTTLEQAHHLGEIIGSLWQGDLTPPEMTWLGVRRRLRSPSGRGSGSS